MRCLLETPGATVPAVWQQMHHVGMGVDPLGQLSYARRHQVAYMAYSVLGGAEGDLGRIAAQPAVRRIAKQRGVSARAWEFCELRLNR